MNREQGAGKQRSVSESRRVSDRIWIPWTVDQASEIFNPARLTGLWRTVSQFHSFCGFTAGLAVSLTILDRFHATHFTARFGRLRRQVVSGQ